MDRFRSSGIGVLGELGGAKASCARSVAPDNTVNCPPDPGREGAYADYVEKVVEHFAGRITYWESWNEANIGYWRGSPQDFYKLHDYAIDGVRRALPAARVGGPDCAGSGGRWTREFFEHCLRGTNYATGRTGTPLDYSRQLQFSQLGPQVQCLRNRRIGVDVDRCVARGISRNDRTIPIGRIEVH